MGPAGDTIVAVATPPGRGGVGIVRVSGPDVPHIAASLLRRVPEVRQAAFRRFLGADGQPLDEGLALLFREPASFTGEHCLELHGHGGPVLLDMLVARVLELGARPARPGEFTERAYLNGKLDLAQAEAVADLIDSATGAAARAALHSLQGEFSERVHGLVEGLIALRIHVEAAIDFPEEEIDFLADVGIIRDLQGLQRRLTGLLANARQGQLLRDGMTVVIAGPPNAGKSSLLNRLAGSDRAIVTDIPGTTRDLLREHISIGGMPLHVIDTAGLRSSDDPVEREGIRRARAEMERADRILLVVDDRLGVTEQERLLMAELPAQVGITLIRNKIDLSAREPGGTAEGSEVWLSATTGAGVDGLIAHLQGLMGYREGGEGAFTARRRHLEALRRADGHLAAAADHLSGSRSGELAAEELRLAQQALGEITGEFSSDELLGRIFSSFCIGK